MYFWVLRVTLLKVIVLSRFLGKFKKFKTDSWFALPVLLFFSGDIKKKKSSENDQLTGHFQSFFIIFFFRPPDPKSEKKFP